MLYNIKYLFSQVKKKWTETFLENYVAHKGQLWSFFQIDATGFHLALALCRRSVIIFFYN